MAVIDIQALLQQKLQEAQGKSESLTDRLSKLDQYNSQVTPMVTDKMLDFSNRPTGYNPLQDIQSAVKFADRQSYDRAAIGQDRDSADNNVWQALLQLADREPKEDDFVKELKKEAAKADIKAGKLKLNPKTGDLEYSDPKELSEEKKTLTTLVDQLLSTDTKPITGLLQVESMIPGTDAQKTVALFEQLKSMLSLENRQKLKGSGAISDFEAKVLEKAASSLTRKLSDKDFKGTLEEMKQELSGKKTSGKKDKKADPLGIL